MKKFHRKTPKTQPEQVDPPRANRQELLPYLFLLVAILFVYSQVRNYGFVNYDDGDVIFGNVHVHDGLTIAGLRWAFTSGYAANWLPITWISHMLDCQLFGLDAGWHHLTNVLIHALSTMLLFALLKRMTGRLWESAFVAFVFALHPLHVESVAWVSERKDVLSAFFCFLTVWAYLDYVDRPKIGRYVLVVLAFSLGLMSKQMIVTLPFVLLLLDVWPLRRIRIGGDDRQKAGALLMEKVPLFALAAAASAITYFVQRKGGAVQSFDAIPFALRAQNALISYVTYVLKLFWPTGLSAFYPYPSNLPIWEVAGAGLAVVAISVLVLRNLRSRPYLAVGWFWYVGTLVPVIGLIQVGGQSRADRYTYLPAIGISIMLAWGMADLFQRWPRYKTMLTAVSVAICSVWLLVTWTQIQYWRDSITLNRHAIEVTPGNYVAHVNLGVILGQQKQTREALEHLSIAVQEKPDYANAHYNLGAALAVLGRNSEAIAEYSEAIRLRPEEPQSHYQLGTALISEGKLNEAAGEFRIAVRLNPEYPAAHFSLGAVLGTLGRNGEAIAELSEAIRLRPNDAEAHYNLGNTLVAAGRVNEAAGEFNTACALNPAFANAHFSLGGVLASLGRLDEAIAHLSEAVRLNPDLQQARQVLERVRLEKAAQ